MVVSLHPEAEEVIREASPELETFVRVQESTVELPALDETKVRKLMLFYLRKFRPKDLNGDEFFPFFKEYIDYAAHRT